MKNRITTGLALLALLAPQAEAQVPSREARVTINAVQRDLASIVQTLRERSGANIEIIDGADEDLISDDLINLQLSDVHWRVALDIAAEKVKGVVVERDSGVLVVTRPPRVSFIFDEAADITEVIKTIATASGANIVVAEEVTGTILVRFEDVPWRHALDVVAKTRGYTVVEEAGGILRVVDPIVLQDQLMTKSYQLRYLRPHGDYVPIIRSEFVVGNAEPPEGNAADHFTLLRALEKALGPKAGAMDYIERQNVIVVRDTQQVHEQVREVLVSLDVEPAQVFCDVKFVSTLNSDLLNLGVDYGTDGPVISGSGGQIPITLPFDPGSGGWEDLIIASPNGNGPYVDPALNGGATVIPSTIFGALSFTQVVGTLRLLQRDTNTEVIQAPKIIALDGIPATIFVGETIRWAEAKSEQGQAGGLQLSLQEATGSPVEIGFQLLIKPTVVPGSDKIMMDVIPKQTALSGTGDSTLAPPGFDVFTIGAAGLEGSIALPRTRSSTIVTSMMLESGQTAVIGGLTTDTDTTTESRVPGLWRIPLLGELFKHEQSNRERRSMMVFLTPTIVHSSADHERLLQRELERRRADLAEQIEALVSGDVSDDFQEAAIQAEDTVLEMILEDIEHDVAAEPVPVDPEEPVETEE